MFDLFNYTLVLLQCPMFMMLSRHFPNHLKLLGSFGCEWSLKTRMRRMLHRNIRFICNATTTSKRANILLGFLDKATKLFHLQTRKPLLDVAPTALARLFSRPKKDTAAVTFFTGCGFRNGFSTNWPFWRTRFYMAVLHVTSVRWPVSTTCLVDEHSVLPMPTASWYHPSNCQQTAAEPLRLRLHTSGIHCQLTSLRQIHCPPSDDR